MTPELDSVQLAVLSARFKGIVKQMANTLFRTGRAGVINTARDFSCCILTGDGEFLTMADSLPIHVMRGSDRQAQVMKEFHPELRAGDAFLHNSPYHGNTHAGDSACSSPVIDATACTASRASRRRTSATVGNSIPTTQFASRARHLRGGRAVLRRRPRSRRTTRTSRTSSACAGCASACPTSGTATTSRSSARCGSASAASSSSARRSAGTSSTTFTRQWFDYSEQMMAAAIKRFPRGEATVRTTHDPFPNVPEGVPLQATVKVDPDEGTIEVDLRDNPDCLPCGLNQSWATITTHAQIPIFNSVGHTVPINAGSFRRINVILRENCCVGIPRHPASCSLGDDVPGQPHRRLRGARARAARRGHRARRGRPDPDAGVRDHHRQRPAQRRRDVHQPAHPRAARAAPGSRAPTAG